MQLKPLKNGYLISTESYQADVNEEWFSANYWHAIKAIVASKQGRTTTWFYEYNDKVFVLKQYRRGGLIGKILSDQYLYNGLKNTRVYKEFELLEQLHAKRLPVPMPKAARVKISGFVYRGELITQAIEGAQSICERCQTRALNETELKEIAETLARFHEFGVYHDDLNINNILFNSDEKVYLIDFDKGELRAPNSQWQLANIERLKRSFDKEATKWPHFYFSEIDWQTLISYYQNALSEDVKSS